MAGTKVNNYSNIDTNIQALQLTTDKVLKGLHQLTLTEMDTTTVPAIAAGSVVECNGALIKYDSEEAIVTTDPHTSATVADGAVYIVVKGADLTAYFTATAPTWSDSKQGYYGLTTWANDRYVGGAYKATSSYTFKKIIFNFASYYIGCVFDAINGSGEALTSGAEKTLAYTTIYNNNINGWNGTSKKFTFPQNAQVLVTVLYPTISGSAVSASWGFVRHYNSSGVEQNANLRVKSINISPSYDLSHTHIINVSTGDYLTVNHIFTGTSLTVGTKVIIDIIGIS